MPSVLLISIRFHDGRYHGVPDWPPSPARLFQALVAAAAPGAKISPDVKAALEWFETQGAPVIAVPVACEAKGFNNFVPNNDLDAVGGDVKRIGEIRAPKLIRPRLFDAETPLLYAWSFENMEGAGEFTKTICDMANDLFQLGRGVDMAWAVCEILPTEQCEERFSNYQGSIHRPSGGVDGTPLACPQQGSLESLVVRHRKSSARFTHKKKGRATETLFSQPPKPRFAQVAYDCPATHLLFDLSGPGSPWPFTRPVDLVELVRNKAAAPLSDALPDKKACVKRIFVGGKDATEADKAARIRIIPLPSIGHQHADRAIRRVLIEIPPDCPLPVGDIEWAFSGLDLSDIDPATGEITVERPVLVAAESRTMLTHYGVENGETSRVWRTVTPAALPLARRRIDPKRMREEAKGGQERAGEEARAAAAVCAALRHADIAAPVESIRVQREPFEARGARAEAFAGGTRFSKERLWHIEIRFRDNVKGPILIGDGRYLGLGLMAPAATRVRDFVVYEIPPEMRPPAVERQRFLRAVRRALMAISRDNSESGEVPRLFSGHEPDGAPARSGAHEHVFLAATGNESGLSRLYVFAPQRADHRTKLPLKDQRCFDSVVSKLESVRAGPLGVITLSELIATLEEDEIVAAARKWTSETPYSPTRHGKAKARIETDLIEDVLKECARRGFPRPRVTIINVDLGPRSGVSANLQLEFRSAIQGPVILGRNAHFGLGLFKTADES